jgi:prepilin peptidase CpaA
MASCLQAVLGLWAAAVVAWDLRRRRLPNVLTLGAAGVAAGWLLAAGATPGGASVGEAVAGGLLALALTLPAWLAGAMGGGDVKLAFALGLLVGVHLLLPVLLLASVLAGVWAAGVLLGRWLGRRRSSAQRREVPFGAAMAFSFLLLWAGGAAAYGGLA